ncbi:hypothetical protein ACQP1W_21155 [Spirillospora sp. CA-255316]
MYEIEADDLEAAVQDLLAAFDAGTHRIANAVETDPPPVTKLLRLTTTHDPAGSTGSPHGVPVGRTAGPTGRGRSSGKRLSPMQELGVPWNGSADLADSAVFLAS